jgi:hypothetical protein
MLELDPIIFRELPVIEKIIQDETWFEGERRGCWVSSNDPAVQENVCRIILRIGRELRETIVSDIAANSGQELQPVSGSEGEQAA